MCRHELLRRLSPHGGTSQIGPQVWAAALPAEQPQNGLLSAEYSWRRVFARLGIQMKQSTRSVAGPARQRLDGKGIP
jgi:hypothetical protein